jgi:hypothetical protein
MAAQAALEGEAPRVLLPGSSSWRVPPRRSRDAPAARAAALCL